MIAAPASRQRVSGWQLVAVLALGIWLALRVALWLFTGPAQIGAGGAASAFLRGLWFDLATLAFLLSPWLLVGAVLPDRWRASRAARVARALLVLATCGWLLFVAVAEFLFWNEFATRFNFIAVDYLIYTHEVIGNIVQSCPVRWLLAGIVATAVALVATAYRLLAVGAPARSGRARLALLAAAFGLPVASFFLADADQLDATGNPYANELAGNGIYTFVSAFRRNELSYDRFYATLPQERADRILAELGVERQPLSEAFSSVESENAATQLGPLLRRPRNVVLISVESLSAEFLGSYGNPKGLTPRLDALAAAGLRFERFFATGTRTVRGLEALSLGIPPVPGQSVVRRPGNEHLATVGEFLEHAGFSVTFLYGGYGYFDNMNAYFRGNDYDVIDRTDFPAESIAFENVWGVADESLHANAVAAFDRAHANGKPFFAHIMTTSNHRPFTYPAGRIDIPSPGGRDGGVKYTDYAIGQLIDAARGRAWFEETLFVVTADHCAAVAGKTRLPVGSYRIPLILYGPKIVGPGVDTRLHSQIDLPPTILDFVGVAGDDYFFGQGIFEEAHLPPRAFVSNYQELGYYKDDLLTVLLPRGRVEAFRIDPATYEATPAAVDRRLADEAIAYYQTAARAFRQRKLGSPAYPR